MSNIIDINTIRNTVIYRIAYKYGVNLENKIDTTINSYDEVKKLIKDMKVMSDNTKMKFKLEILEKIEIKTTDLLKEL
jgi:hypothetical protein